MSLGVKNYFNNGGVVWNKGKTKYTDARLAKYSNHPIFKDKVRNNKIRLAKLGKKRTFSEEWKKNLGKANIRVGKWKGKNNPMYIDGLSRPYACKTHGIPMYEWKAIRRRILEQNGDICNICHSVAKPPVIDHIIPYRVSFNNDETNLQVLCRRCHAKKDFNWEGFLS